LVQALVSELQTSYPDLYFRWKQVAHGRRAFFPLCYGYSVAPKARPRNTLDPGSSLLQDRRCSEDLRGETYVLRFWESQFPQLKPNKSGTGQRLYRRRDVEMVLDIKRLVHGEGYTISGARQALDQTHRRRDPQLKLAASNADPATMRDSVSATIGHARAELREIMGLLGAPAAPLPRRRTRVAQFAAISGSLFPS